MNREETIKWLKSLKAEIGKSEHRTLWHYAEALDMAIEVLTYQNLSKPNNTCEVDLISREDAMGAVQDHFNADGFKGYYDGQQMMDRINALPSAETDGWIPCSERLPSAEDCPMDCMVTRQSKYVGNYTDMAVAEADGTWTHEDWKAITIKGEATCISTRDADIIAWMPLPKPYREESEVEE